MSIQIKLKKITIMFSSANTSEITTLKQEIIAKRDMGEVILEIKQLTSAQTLIPENIITIIDTLVNQLGYHPLGANWQEINLQTAEKILTFALTKDLAYSTSMMSESEAAKIIVKLINLFPGTPQFFTNLSNINNDSIMSAWNSLTDATFDTGIVIINKDLCGLIWFQDED